MRKNLLTLMLGLSFLFFGMFVITAEASTGSSDNLTKSQISKFSKSISKIELIKKYSTSNLKLKKECANGWICDVMIRQSAEAFDRMIAACDYAEESPGCHQAQADIEWATEETLVACAVSELIPINRPKRLIKSSIPAV